MTPPLRLLRVANPLVRAVLRSPAHPLLSGSLVLLEYEGRRTGQRFRVPVLASADERRTIALAARPRSKQWWRTFRRPTSARLLDRGSWRDVTGEVLLGAERRDALRLYLGRFPRAGGALGASLGSSDAEVDAVEAALVAFTPRP